MLHLNTVFGSFGWIFESKLFSFPSFGFLSKRKSPPNSIRQQVVWSAQSKHFSFNSRLLQTTQYFRGKTISNFCSQWQIAICQKVLQCCSILWLPCSTFSLLRRIPSLDWSFENRTCHHTPL